MPEVEEMSTDQLIANNETHLARLSIRIHRLEQDLKVEGERLAQTNKDLQELQDVVVEMLAGD